MKSSDSPTSQLSHYQEIIAYCADADVAKLCGLKLGTSVTVGGVILNIEIRTTNRDQRFCLFQLKDQFGLVNVIAWPNALDRLKENIVENLPAIVSGRIEIFEGVLSIIADEIQRLETLQKLFTQTVILHLRPRSIDTTKTDHHLIDLLYVEVPLDTISAIRNMLPLNISSFQEQLYREQDISKPPRWAEYLLYLFLQRKDRVPIVGDLKEEYREIYLKFGLRKANIWYYKQVFTSLFPLFRTIRGKIAKWGLLGMIVELFRRLFL